jgi:hypothetical protein
MPKTINLTVELSDDEAMALAQFIKRLTFTSIIERTSDQAEAASAHNAFFALTASLRESGYDPR